MDIEKLYQILRECTVQLRKGGDLVIDGEPASEKQRELMNEGEIEGQVIEIFSMPHESDINNGIEKVDVHFVTIGVDKNKAESHREELLEILREYPQPERLAGGPSYIEVGGVIGDQGAAFQLFALGKVLGLWNIIIPETLGFTGPEADQMAGMGFVTINGFKKTK